MGYPVSLIVLHDIYVGIYPSILSSIGQKPVEDWFCVEMGCKTRKKYAMGGCY